MTSNVITKESFLTVAGKRFHYIWLRDNCLCPQCSHPTSFQKLYEISGTSTPEPLSWEEKDGELRITWKEDPAHVSIFPISWLLAHAYDDESEAGSANQQPESDPHNQEILWDKAWIEANISGLQEALSSDPELWLNQLLTVGFTVLHNIEFKDLQPMLESIGPIYKSDYGLFAPSKTTKEGKDLAETGNGMSLHTDYTYWHTPPLLSCLYCVENDASGGESLITDGFRVVDDFRQQHPDHFQLLTQTPIQFKQVYTEWQYFYSRTQPILELDDSGKVTRINFANSHSYSWKLPFDQMEAFYAAYTTFFLYLKNPVYQYCFRLQPGDLLLMNDSRIMHGRKAFAGNRHLEIACISWDFLEARQRFHQYKHLYVDR
ncbi:MAG: DUF971 domain-containing protein [Moorea sp. SIO4E2]|uniref:TauD/TfdA family dioxygenase n=1 Tax=Moorena sp. SIO4E2 TaxID=2607826 RepID=UPI0013BA8209|nr:TauD/TfdA family dioxygenase [Moorena sp. SIO4E2]NEQ05234.1 DUF971 domain-containing protein [Moorena sp. SIO4E2]